MIILSGCTFAETMVNSTNSTGENQTGNDSENGTDNITNKSLYSSKFLKFPAVNPNGDNDTIYVSINGDDSNTGYTLTTAKKTIKNATGTVNAGGTVIIDDGTYNGTGNTAITLSKSMTIRGSGQSATVLDGLGNSRIFTVNSGCTVTIEDLTITKGKATAGAGIFVLDSGNLNVNNCKFTKGTTTYSYFGGGSAICTGDYTTLNVQNSIFTDNDATKSTIAGGAICLNNTANIENCNFISNYADKGGAIFFNYGGTLNIENCKFIKNSAINDGGALAIYTANCITNIHNSAFINNTATGGSFNIYNANDATLNVPGNWWDSNNGPNGIYGLITDDSTWIYMNTSLDHNSTYYGGKINVLTDFNNLYHKATGTVTHEDINSLLDGWAVNYSSDIGYLTPVESFISNGISNSVFTANNIGLGNITSTFNQILKNGITVDKANSGLTVNNSTGYYGKKVNLTTYLVDDNNSPLSGKSITFKVNGVEVGSAVTDSEGTAKFEYPITQTQGTYEIMANFSGDSYYNESQSTGKLTVNMKNTTLSVDNISTNYGRVTNLTAHILDNDSEAVKNANITFKVNGVEVGSVLTNSEGKATLPYKVTQTMGTYNIEANYTGDNVYNNSTGNATLTVNVIKTVLTVQDITSKHGDSSNLTAKLTDINGTPVAGQKIDFKINGSLIGVKTTNNKGISTLPFTLQNSGLFALNCNYGGDNVFVNSSGTGNVNIIPVTNLYLTGKVNSDTIRVDNQFLIIYKLNNKGWDSASNVSVKFFIPSNLKFKKAVVDDGKTSYNQNTNSLTWNTQALTIGNHYLILSAKAVKSGNCKIESSIKTSTYPYAGNQDIFSLKIKENTDNSNNGSNDYNINQQFAHTFTNPFINSEDTGNSTDDNQTSGFSNDSKINTTNSPNSNFHWLWFIIIIAFGAYGTYRWIL